MSPALFFATGINESGASVDAFYSNNSGRIWSSLGTFYPGNGANADISFTNSTQGLFQLLPAGANLAHTLYAYKSAIINGV